MLTFYVDMTECCPLVIAYGEGGVLSQEGLYPGGVRFYFQRRCLLHVGYLLFCGVIELIFVRSAEALLHAVIGPQSFHGGQKFVRERLRVLHT